MNATTAGSSRTGGSAADVPLIRFEGGIPGFPDVRAFVLQTIPDHERWFRLIGEEGEPAFLVVDPFLIVPDYEIEVPDDLLPGAKQEDVMVLAIVRVPEDPREATVNLRAPLVVDMRHRRGVQWVPTESPHSLRHPLFPHRPEAVGV
ncbi:flagellar assembly protein FliW [Kyrpidia spormannii]|nr:flagellar assembly protein FliW [Kyrpidia spormannii]